MSHFAVLVAIPEDDGDLLKKALQPYHEFECTDEDDEYVQDVEELDEYKQSYEASTLNRLRAPDGSLHCPYDDEFYRDPTDEERPHVGMGSGTGNGIQWHSKDWGDGKGYRPKVKFIPEGYEKVDVPSKELMTFLEYVKDNTGRPVINGNTVVSGDDDQAKYGYIKVNDDGEVISVVDRTNPNKKLDWWTVGGRFSNHLLLKSNDSGVTTFADYAKKSEVDFEGMIANGRKEAEEEYAKAMRDIEGAWEPWSSFLAKHEANELTIDQCRDQYHAQEALVKAKANLGDSHFFFRFDELLVGKDEYIKRGGEKAIQTFAILHNGQWFQKGDMGWFGCVSDEKDKASFDQGYTNILNSIPDDHYLVVVDCHI